MPKHNRGKTTKLSIRLSTAARHKIEITAKNLGISMAGVILFELPKILKNPPSMYELETIEENISLERNHFVLTVNERMINRINDMSQDFDRKKNSFIGYLVSNHFENLSDLHVTEDYDKTKRIMIQVNETLKKKMMEYSEENFIPINAVIAYSILEGPYEGLPQYDEAETVQIFSNVPPYIGEMVKEESEDRNIREHFYTSLCLYKQFMTPEGRFFE